MFITLIISWKLFTQISLLLRKTADVEIFQNRFQFIVNQILRIFLYNSLKLNFLSETKIHSIFVSKGYFCVKLVILCQNSIFVSKWYCLSSKFFVSKWHFRVNKKFLCQNNVLISTLKIVNFVTIFFSQKCHDFKTLFFETLQYFQNCKETL